MTPALFVLLLVIEFCVASAACVLISYWRGWNKWWLLAGSVFAAGAFLLSGPLQ